MMFNKRALIAWTVVLTAGTALAACSSKPEEGGQAKEGAPAEKKDITVSIYDRGQVSQQEGTIENNRWTKWINEKGPANVQFIPIPRTSPQEKINVLYASGSAPDLLFEYDGKIRMPLYDQKQLMPIDGLIDKYSTVYKKLLADNPVLKKAGTKADGKLYEFGTLNWVEPSRGVLIRADWLKKLQLDMPKTTEELYKVAKAFAEQDPDANGKKDTYGIAVSGASELTVNQMFQSLQKWVVKDGQLVVGWDQMKEANLFKKRLYDEGLIDKDYINDKNGAKAKQDFINGKIGIYPFLSSEAVDLITSLVDPLKKNVASADISFMPYPQSPFGQFVPTLRNPVSMTGVVSASTKNPDAVMKYVDFITEKSVTDTLQNGIEGEHYNKVEGCYQVIDKDKTKKQVTDITVDMLFLANNALKYDQCSIPLVRYGNDPRKQEYQSFYQSFRDTYLNFNLPYADLTHSEHMPIPPKDLNLIQTNADKAIADIWTKLIVSGDKYTADQALKDAKGAWDQSGGKQVEDWYKNWYTTSKDNAILAKDIFDIARKQDEQYKKLLQQVKK